MSAGQLRTLPTATTRGRYGRDPEFISPWRSTAPNWRLRTWPRFILRTPQTCVDVGRGLFSPRRRRSASIHLVAGSGGGVRASIISLRRQPGSEPAQDNRQSFGFAGPSIIGVRHERQIGGYFVQNTRKVRAKERTKYARCG